MTGRECNDLEQRFKHPIERLEWSDLNAEQQQRWNDFAAELNSSNITDAEFIKTTIMHRIAQIEAEVKGSGK